MNNAIILIHGLYMDRFSMKIMQKRFQKQGYSVYLFAYPTVLFNKDKTIKRLHHLINKIKEENVVLIGHSMGGLIARIYGTESSNPKVTAIITLGTPHQGSYVAKYLSKTPLKILLGKSGDSGILTPLPSWNGQYPLGCLIGKSNYGVNYILKKYHKNYEESDGNVFISEARLENAKDTKIIPCAHSNMLFNRSIIDECVHFIKNHVFVDNYLKII